MMKILTTILLFSNAAKATTYYLSNAGSNSNNGTSTSTTWQTNEKINSFTFAANDSILYKAGETFTGQLIPPRNDLHFGTYGTGKATLTGFTDVTGFSQNGNIWSKTLTGVPKDLNTVYIDGALRVKARYPNGSYLANVSFPSTSQLVVSHSATDYTGYGIAIRTANWVIDRVKITSVNTGATNDTFNLSPQTTYNTLGGYYFLQNNENLLDSAYEWSFDSTTNFLKIYSTTEPTVKVSTVDTLVWISGKSNITFNNLNFTGSNKAAIEILNTSNIRTYNCLFDSHGQNGITETFAAIPVCSDTYSYRDTFTNCLSGGYYIDPGQRDSVIECYFKNIGKYEGMGKNGNGTYIGLYILSYASNHNPHPYVYRNKLDSCGYIGIRFRGENSLIKNNYVSNFGFVKDDGGGIYTFVGNGYQYYDSGSVITNNIVRKGIGAPPAGLNRYAHGIYLDAGVTGVTVSNNTVDSCTFAGISTNGARHSVLNNTVRMIEGTSLYSGATFVGTSFNYIFKNNLFYKDSSTFHTYVLYLTGNKDTTEIIDSNYYLLRTAGALLSRNTQPFTLAEWRAYSGYDAHSSDQFPDNIISQKPSLFYNPTFSDSTVHFTGNYIDARGAVYQNQITLQPFQSALLFRAAIQPTFTRKVGGFNFQ